RDGEQGGDGDTERTAGQGGHIGSCEGASPPRSEARQEHHWMAVSISSIQASELASISASVRVSVFSGCGRPAKAGSSSSPRSTTGNIQLVVGITACPSAEARYARNSLASSCLSDAARIPATSVWGKCPS